MAKAWQFRLASTWEVEAMRDPDRVFGGKPTSDQAEFERLLSEGWEPIGAWGKSWGSAFETVVALKKKVEVPSHA